MLDPRRLCVAALLVLSAASGIEAAAPPGEWWNAGYRYRQKLNLTAGATAIPTQYSVRLQLDHSALVFASQSLASGNDVRVAYWNGSGWVELDRVLDDQATWNNAATRIWFRTQALIGASSTDDNYYLYYGNSGAGTPPTNWANVFLFYDDFNDGVFDAARWICADPFTVTPPAVCAESAAAPGTISLQDDTALYSTGGFAFGTDTRWESRLRLATNTAPATRFYNYFGASDMAIPANPYSSDWATFYVDTQHWLQTANNLTNTPLAPAPAVATPTSYHVYTFDREGAAGVRFFQDGTQVGNIPSSLPDANLRVLVWNDSAAANGIVLDWVRVRKYVTPEPTFTTAASEFGPGGMQVLSGTYVGNGALAGRSIDVGFRPDLVIISSDSTNANVGTGFPSGNTAVLRSSTMVGNVSKAAYVYNNHPLADRITSLDPTGFTVGHPANHSVPNDDPNDPYHCVNHNGVRYYWTALRAAPGQMAVGFYTGNGAATQDVTTVGFQPDYTMVLPDTADDVIQRFALMPADYSFDFDGGSQCPALCSRSPESGIRTELANGFRVGQYVNNNTSTYHYVAWKQTPGRIKVGSYTGNSPTDNRSINPVGFRPEFVQVVNGKTPIPNSSTTFKPASTGSSTDYSLVYVAYTSGYQGPDDIQALEADGFQIGQGNNVNGAGEPHYYAAFGPHTPQINYRSIGPAAPESTGTLTATNGSADLTGAGTLWRTRNRGRGDVITICDNPPLCTTNVDYVVLSVASDASLSLTTPYAGTTGGGKTFTLKRQFTRPSDWVGCIDGPPGCSYFPTLSASLVADDRSELGILYNDDGPDADALPEPFLPPAIGQEIAWITGFTSDPTHTVTLTADPGNRHSGVAWSGSGATPHVVLNNSGNTTTAIFAWADFVTVEWLEIRGSGPGTRSGIGVGGFGSVTPSNGSVSSTLIVRNNIIHTLDMAVDVGDTSIIADIYNNFIYNCTRGTRIDSNQTTDPSLIRVFNNTALGCSDGFHVGLTSNGRVQLRNNIAAGSGGNDFWLLGALGLLSSDNLSEDATATGASPGGGDEPNRPINGAGGVNFVDDTLPTIDLHLQGTSWALDRAVDLSAAFNFDIDGGGRVLPWDIGADDRLATTEVALVSFEARGVDAAVELTWETASELSNLGFNLYRATALEGSYARITTTTIPGLGSSPVGAKYSHRDAGLENGVTYFYRLEDIDTTGKATLHGPVSATPSSGVPPDARETRSLITYGRPEENRFRVLERTSTGVVLELQTEGFTAEPQEDGSVRLEIPGFEPLEGSPSVPVLRPWIEALSGRGAAIASVRESSRSAFSGLRPSGAGANEIVATRRGAVRARLGAARAHVGSKGLVPTESARLLQVGFQGESKKAQLELAPLRWNGVSQELVLARRLTVRLEFRGRAVDQRGRAARGRSVATRLVTARAGLHEVAYEALFSRGGRGVLVDALRLSRLGKPVAFHVEPEGARFGPGGKLYFVSEDPKANPYGRDLVYKLELGGGGLLMQRGSARPSGEIVASYSKAEDYEENRLYQAGLVDAPDRWLWDVLFAPVAKSFPFAVKDLAPGPSRLTVWLQGASDFAADPDHHVRLYVNDVFEHELWWDGKEAQKVEVPLSSGALREGENVLQIENTGDTEASYSMVMLDRFQVVFPRRTLAEEGRFEGSFPVSGTALVSGLGASHLLDTTDGTPRWLSGAEVSADGVTRFRAEADRSYLAVSRSAVERPLVRAASRTRLRKETLAADYLVIGPHAFSTEAAPLLSQRRSQGLTVKFASLEDVYTEFGFGEARPEAIRDFLSYAYHYWQSPKLRYVLLLGDATYDFKDYLKTGVPNQLPPLMVKTSYLWTASDPTLAAVNGDDLLPDVAIGRLPASSTGELRIMVSKILAYERGDVGLDGLVVLAADNPDAAGDFPGDADAIAGGVLAGRPVRRLYLHQLGSSMTGEILRAFDEGASLVSYIGHGGIQLWADENVLDTSDVDSLAPQPQQPLLLTMNCLNGYFHFPYFDSLAEKLLKVDARGAIAAFSPSGLSLNAPAQLFHQALLDEVFHHGHERLGDAVLVAQARYAATGAFPDLLSIYHLLGDPALRLR